MNPLLLFMLCFLLVLICMANHLCMYIRTQHVDVRLLGIGAQSLVEWGNMELEQPFLSQATRFSNS